MISPGLSITVNLEQITSQIAILESLLLRDPHIEYVIISGHYTLIEQVF